MKTRTLSRQYSEPTNAEELLHEPILKRHEGYLRRLIETGRTPIYLGDHVTVSMPWAGQDNSWEGHSGIVTDIAVGIRSIYGSLSPDYLLYTMKDDGDGFNAFHYTLTRTEQAPGNKLLEKILRELL